MELTDEQVIDAFFEEGSYVKAARRFNISGTAINTRLRVMRVHGVNVPRINFKGSVTRFTPERVAELNEYIQQKVQEADARKD